MLLVNHALARGTPAILVIFVVSRGSSSKALFYRLECRFVIFAIFVKNPLFLAGQKHDLPKTPFSGPRVSAYEMRDLSHVTPESIHSGAAISSSRYTFWELKNVHKLVNKRKLLKAASTCWQISCVSISLTIDRGHLGLSAQSPKKISTRVPGPLGPGNPTSQKGVENKQKTREKLEKLLIFDRFLTFWAPRIERPLEPFSRLFLTLVMVNDISTLATTFPRV